MFSPFMINFTRLEKNSNLNIVMDNQQNSQPKFGNEVEKDINSQQFVTSDDCLDRHETESDLDSLEPQEFGTNDGELNVDDPRELRYWAEQFQISTGELKSAALLRGNSILEIKKYISA
ncbi:DUF3606 domain-containing protein [Pedobacter chinensis]|uniref:DUF3606 domain-containing protein n=2 Tax=Pedobacter TaxID=84567 RepID=A0A369PWZ2_9SPHI|nr:DUF3606 domain-containing protein [Pedobacter chinensis]RZJ88654.1 MAG: DUF3606 domain-containing protein [Chryseobacterium sp.]